MQSALSALFLVLYRVQCRHRCYIYFFDASSMCRQTPQRSGLVGYKSGDPGLVREVINTDREGDEVIQREGFLINMVQFI